MDRVRVIERLDLKEFQRLAAAGRRRVRRGARASVGAVCVGVRGRAARAAPGPQSPDGVTYESVARHRRRATRALLAAATRTKTPRSTFPADSRDGFIAWSSEDESGRKHVSPGD